jgi:hypothetical protein
MKAKFGKRDILLLLSAAAICAALLGCETSVVRQAPPPSSPGPSTPSTPAQSAPPEKLINETGANATVWIEAGGIGERSGFILYSDKTVKFFNDYASVGGSVEITYVNTAGKWEFKNEALYITGITGCTAGLEPCQYAVTTWIRSEDKPHEYELTLERAFEYVEGGRTNYDEIMFYKMSMERLLAGYLEKRPAVDRAAPVRRYVSLVE